MPVKRRVAKLRNGQEVSDAAWAFLHDEPFPPDTRQWDRYELEHNCKLGTCEPVVELLWADLGADITAQWAKDHPGTRPSAWWRFSAPRGPYVYQDSRRGALALEEPRRRVGGVGTPAYETLAYVPRFGFGIPVDWADDRSGQDPPTFESEAAYLERHGLLTAAERRRLKAADFEPESIYGG